MALDVKGRSGENTGLRFYHLGEEARKEKEEER